MVEKMAISAIIDNIRPYGPYGHKTLVNMTHKVLCYLWCNDQFLYTYLYTYLLYTATCTCLDKK